MRHEEAARNRAEQVRRQMGGGNQNLEATITAILGRILGQYSNQIRTVSDKTLTLNGEREANLAAVRLGHLKPIVELRTNTKAKKVDAPPTAEQYNVLLKDLRAVYAALDQLSSALKGELERGKNNKR